MSDMKCPFCQQELREIYFNGVGVGYICPNPDCKKAEKLKGNAEFWQELIRTHKALDVAKVVLTELHKYAKLDGIQEYDVYEALDKITALEQKDNK